MKKSHLMSLMLISAIAFQSCGVLKTTLSSAPDRFVASYEAKVIEIQDSKGYIQHAQSLGLQEIELELIKGILFKPVSEFGTAEGEESTATIIKMPLAKIKAYSRILH